MAQRECPDCDGDGKCSDCHGTGSGGALDYLAAALTSVLGEEGAEEMRECDTCGGSGVCQTCNGEGYIEE